MLVGAEGAGVGEVLMALPSPGAERSGDTSSACRHIAVRGRDRSLLWGGIGKKRGRMTPP